MSKRKPTNVGASVKARLLKISKERGEDFTLTLVRYSAERFLYRLSQSRHARSFILKGAMLLAAQAGSAYRSTRDVDFLQEGESSADSVRAALSEIAQLPGDDDGLAFLADYLEIEEIRQEHEYRGWRVSMRAVLDTARIPLQIDIAYGDTIVPGTVDIEYPALLKESGPKVRAYPIETIFSEKVEAMVKLGMTNSRLKDYYDLIVLSETFELAGVVLTEAVRATCGRRETPLPSGLAAGLTDEFVAASEVRWKAFLSANDLRDIPPKLADAVARLRTFVSPVLEAAAKGKTVPERWIPAKGWT